MHTDAGEGYVITDAWLDLTREQDLVDQRTAAGSIEPDEDGDYATGLMWGVMLEGAAGLLAGFGWLLWCWWG